MKIKVARFLVKTLTILTLIIGTIAIMQMNVTIIQTSAKLISLNMNIQHYNEQPRKTDAMTDDYISLEAERQEIYNSDDAVERIFSNLNVLVKFTILLWALSSFLLMPFMWLILIVREIETFKCIHTCQRRKYKKRK